MTWKGVTVSEQRQRFLEDFQLNYYSVSDLAERFGISRNTAYRWINRFKQYGQDGYHSFAADLAVARDANNDDHAANITSSANAYRSWALAHPEQYDLIFGTPIPGYHAPMEITGPAAAKSMLVLVQVLDAAYQDGVLSLVEPSPALLTLLQPWADHLDYAGPPGVIHLALASWAQIHGLVSLELFGHLAPAPAYGDVAALFEAEIKASVKRMGIG